MVEFEGPGDFDGGGDDSDDDIARFERQCAERAKAQGLLLTDDAYDDGDINSDNDEYGTGRRANGIGAAAKIAGGDGDAAGWKQKCAQLQEKLARREADLAQARNDLELVKSDAPSGVGDVGQELKQRLLDLTKRNRRMQVNVESERSKVKQLENELRKPREDAKKKSDERLAQQTDAALGDGFEDWKQKYLTTSNTLQQVRHEAQELRAQAHKQKKVLLKELGSEDALAAAMSVVDDPATTSWRGRAAEIKQLQRQVKDLREQPKRGGGEEADLGPSTPPNRRPAAQGKPEDVFGAGEKALRQAADKRREEFEKLQDETEKLRQENGEVKRKRDAAKFRASALEEQLKKLKEHVQVLVQKSEHDDEFVATMRRQLERKGGGGGAGGDGGGDEALRRENAELQAQVDRQAQIVLQLRQKNLAAACENGSTRLGPQSVEGSTSQGALIERVRYLEAENARQSEQVRLYRSQNGDSTPGCRPYSADVGPYGHSYNGPGGDDDGGYLDEGADYDDVT